MEKQQSFEALRLTKNQASHIRINNKGKQILSIIRNETVTQKNNTINSVTDRTLSKLLPISKSTNLMNSSNISGLTVSEGRGPAQLNQKRNFYHHTTIFKMDEYKDLTKQHFYLVDNTSKPEEVMNSRLEEAQRKIMISDFKRKVAEFLMTAKYKKDAATKNFRKYYTDLKIKTQSIEASLHQSYIQNIGSFQWDGQGEAFAQSQLILHRYNQAEFTVQVKDNKGKVQKKQIQNQKIQQRLLRKLEPFLSNDKIDYDQKMRYMLLQFETIVDRLENEAFYMSLPTYCKENPSDFNDYYDVDPIVKKRQYETYLNEKILDQLVEHVKDPVDDGFFSRPSTAELRMQEEQMRLEKEKQREQQRESLTNEAQENIDQRSSDDEIPELDENGNPTGRKIKREKLQRDPKPRGNQQSGHQEDDLPPIGPIQRNLEEEALIEMQRQKEMDRLKEEERERQKQERKREIERIEQEILSKKNQADPEFKYQRGSENDPQFKKKDRKKQDQQPPAGEKKKKGKREPRQKPPGVVGEPQTENNPQVQDTSSKKGQVALGVSQLPQIQVAHPKKNSSRSPQNNQKANRDSINRQDSMISQMSSQFGENSSVYQNAAKLQSEHSQNQTKNQSYPSTHRGQENEQHQLLLEPSNQGDEILNQQQIDQNESGKLIEDGKAAAQPMNQKESDDKKKATRKAEQIVNQLTQPSSNQQNPITETNKLRNEMEVKLNEIESKLQQSKLNIFDLLMNAPNVYDVDIDDYKLNHQDSRRVDVPNIEGDDEKSIYREIYSWREEVLNLIPILKEVRKDAKPALEEDSDESDSSEEENKKKKKRKGSEDTD